MKKINISSLIIVVLALISLIISIFKNEMTYLNIISIILGIIILILSMYELIVGREDDKNGRS